MSVSLPMSLHFRRRLLGNSAWQTVYPNESSPLTVGRMRNALGHHRVEVVGPGGVGHADAHRLVAVDVLPHGALERPRPDLRGVLVLDEGRIRSLISQAGCGGGVVGGQRRVGMRRRGSGGVGVDGVQATTPSRTTPALNRVGILAYRATLVPFMRGFSRRVGSGGPSGRGCETSKISAFRAIGSSCTPRYLLCTNVHPYCTDVQGAVA